MKLTMRGTFFLVLLLSIVASRGAAQSVFIRWSAVDAGFGTQVLNGTKLASVVGQSFAGLTLTGASRVLSGFLAERLLRGNVTGVGENKSLPLPTTVVLNQNYPNPFNPSTTIRYGLPGRSHVLLTVYNILGQRVVELVNEDVDGGYHEVQFNAGNLASGVYFYRLQTSALRTPSGGSGGAAAVFVETKRLNLVK